MIGLLLLGCAEEPCLEGYERAEDGNCYETPWEPVIPPEVWLRRASLDLTGQLPSAESLDAVVAQPTRLRREVRALLADPAHEERLVEVLGEQWHTLVDDFGIQAMDLGVEEFAYERSAGEEPLRLMAHIGSRDRPWTDIVLADHTMANATLAEMWQVERVEGEGWTQGTYVDGRPAAGILATNGLFWRYRTTPANANRGRAAELMKRLVCDDLHARPVSFDIGEGLVTEGADDAVLSHPTCVSCHVALEPVAASLFGWYWFEPFSGLEAGTYHPEREPYGEEVLGVEAGWYGQPVDGLSGLGLAIASDARFDRCQAQQFTEALWRTTLDPLEDADRLDDVVQAWRADELRLSGLLETLVMDDAYALAPARHVAADQLATVVEQLTGFVWTTDGFDLMRTDTSGFRTLAGGVDGRYVLKPAPEPSLTQALVTKRLAEAAAEYAVRNGTFFTVATVATTPDAPEFAQQLDAWAWRLTADRADVDGLTALWTEVATYTDAEDAWAAVIAASLRDPALVIY